MAVSPWSVAQSVVYVVLLLALVRPFGFYLHRVFEGPRRPLPRFFGPVERFVFRVCGVDPNAEQSAAQYAFSLLTFSALGMLGTFGILRLQHVLPLNPQGLPAVEPALAFNTAASFTTNTNWQFYGGEVVMSYFSQMAGLAWHNFTSAAAGFGVALALARGLCRRPGADEKRALGNFWADLLRSILYVFLPLSIVFALFFVSQGTIQNFAPYQTVTTLEGGTQVVALGPTASQEVIKNLGINGGGFFNANATHPYENPTPLTNFVQLLLIFAIPAALTRTYGLMAGDVRQGRVLLGAMTILFVAALAVAHWAEAQGNPALRDLGVSQFAGNMEGKETRFGSSASSLFAVVTTSASCGAVNAMHDSFTPLGGLVALLDIMLGEVIFGGVGAGLYGMLVFVLLAVFIAGLMVGRTPEYLGKKIEAREMKLCMLYVLVFPILILLPASWAAATELGSSAIGNRGPHGLSEILYAFSSGAGNNGSAFGGLAANHPWWHFSMGFAMLGGRFLMMLPVLAIAGGMLRKKSVPEGPGTFPTNGPLFMWLLIAIVLILGALTFVPALFLGPIAEHFIAETGVTFE